MIQSISCLFHFLKRYDFLMTLNNSKNEGSHINYRNQTVSSYIVHYILYKYEKNYNIKNVNSERKGWSTCLIIPTNWQ